MDNSFQPQSSDTQRPDTFFTTLIKKVFESTFHWLVGFIQLTEEEQREAGIYLDRPYEE
jgi:hypothetical protein